MFELKAKTSSHFFLLGIEIISVNYYTKKD